MIFASDWETFCGTRVKIARTGFFSIWANANPDNISAKRKKYMIFFMFMIISRLIPSNLHPLSCLIENDKQKNMLSQ